MPKTPIEEPENALEVIDPSKYYVLRGKRRFDFEGVKFGPLIHTEISGDVLERLAQSPMKDAIEAPRLIFDGTPHDPQV